MLGMTGNLVFTALCSILFLLVLGISENAYAREYVAPPDVSISEIRDGELPPVPEWIKQAALEVREPVSQFKEFGNMRVEFRPLYTTVNDPSFHIVGPGGTLAGVGDLIIFVPGEGFFRCSGVLLPTGIHILTAAHCVTSSGVIVPGTTGDVLFETATGDVVILFSNIIVHPAWDGDFIRGNDIAIIELVSQAPANVPTYDIDRDGSNDLGVAFDKAGYGRSGTGLTGDTIPSGVKRQGKNLYNALADTMLVDPDILNLEPGTDFVPGSVLHFDFDNGLAENDAFDVFFGISELGLGTDEVMSAGGDSGGPTFDGQEITAITSYGFRLSFEDSSTSDVNSMLDSSFGEFGGDTRVSLYANWIDSKIDLRIFCNGFTIKQLITSGVYNVIDNRGGPSQILSGTAGPDLMLAGSNGDEMIGKAGDDCIIGGSGNDILKGRSGNDTIIGGGGHDTILGGVGIDELFGGNGNDILRGASGVDTIRGSAGDDKVVGGSGNDNLFGGSGVDVLKGGDDDDTLKGGSGDDTLRGNNGNDTLKGAGGNDVCIGGPGTDTLKSCEVT